MRVLVVGYGSIGRRHIDNLRSIDPSAELALWRHAPGAQDARADESPPSVRSVFYDEIDALAWQPDVALTTNPAPFHVPVAQALADRGVHLFVESLCPTAWTGSTSFSSSFARAVGRPDDGFDLRFSPTLQLLRRIVADGEIGRPLGLHCTVGQYLPEWRLQTPYGQTVSARRELGGGVILELSHELDYARWLLGEVTSVSAHAGQVSELEIDVEDTADILLQFACGALGNVHLDMLDRPGHRGCRVVGSEGTAVWDAQAGCVRVYRASSGSWEEFDTSGLPSRNDIFLDELRHFLQCVSGEATPSVSGEEAKRVLELSLAAKESAATGNRVNV